MQLRGDDDGDRMQVVEGVLEDVSRVIATAVGRKERKALSRRTEALLEDLDVDEVPAWLALPWSAEQATAVLEASEKLWATEKAATRAPETRMAETAAGTCRRGKATVGARGAGRGARRAARRAGGGGGARVSGGDAGRCRSPRSASSHPR